MGALDEFIKALEDYSKEECYRGSPSIEIDFETAGYIAVRLKACAGHSNETLEALARGDIQESEAARYKQQRDELLVAARGVQNILAVFPDVMLREGEAQRIINFDEAIAKAGGE